MPESAEVIPDRMLELLAGEYPGSELIDAASALSDWMFCVHLDVDAESYVYLEGSITRHPRIPDGKVSTSRLLWVDHKLRWALTADRFYELVPRKEGR